MRRPARKTATGAPKRRASLKAPVQESAGDATKGRISESASRLFAERGKDGVSVRDICAAAAVNLAAIGYHFGGKDELYLEVLRDSAARATVRP